MSPTPAGTVSASDRRRARGRKAARPDFSRSRREAFNLYFEHALQRRRELPPSLAEAMAYAALSPGKRLRPLLVFAGCEAVGGRWRRALPAAAAVEAVHAFSLVHDDLPAMDDDDYRRGLPTTHKRFGEALAILAGDALLALAFEELAELARRGVPHRRVVVAVSWLARASGGEELIAGQTLDIEAEGRKLREAQIKSLHLHKTGALFGVALGLGGIVGGGDARQLEALRAAGRELGLAFQIRDDLLNVGSSLERLGKRSGTDSERGKATYPAVLGETMAERRAAAYLNSARAILEDHRLLSRGLARLLSDLAAREH